MNTSCSKAIESVQINCENDAERICLHVAYPIKCLHKHMGNLSHACYNALQVFDSCNFIDISLFGIIEISLLSALSALSCIFIWIFYRRMYVFYRREPEADSFNAFEEEGTRDEHAAIESDVSSNNHETSDKDVDSDDGLPHYNQVAYPSAKISSK